MIESEHGIRIFEDLVNKVERNYQKESVAFKSKRNQDAIELKDKVSLEIKNLEMNITEAKAGLVRFLSKTRFASDLGGMAHLLEKQELLDITIEGHKSQYRE